MIAAQYRIATLAVSALFGMVATSASAGEVFRLPSTFAPASALACHGQRSFVRRGWHLARGLSVEPKTADSELAYRAGEGWHVARLGSAPGADGKLFHPLTASSAEVDADGTVVFVASWLGNVDQANNIGRGIYRLRPGGVETLVDAFAMVPGQTFRFNAFGTPDVEQGTVVFWGGRDGGQWSGLYLWRQGLLSVVAEPRGGVAPLSGGDLRGERVAFQGQDRHGPAMFVWQTESRQLTRLFGRGDAMPDGERAAYFFDVALGEHIAAFGVGYDSVTDARGIHMKRRILGWHEGATWVVVDPAWFKAPSGEAMYLEPIPVVDRDSVAFRLHAGRYVETWVATGCTLERVSKSGDWVGDKEVRDFATLERESFTGGRIDMLANFTDGSQGYVRASRK